MKTVVFYNHANLGDLHISRELVKYVMKHAGAGRYVYAHRHSPRILQDIDGLEQSNDLSCYNAHAASDTAESEVHLNTWYAVSPVWNNGYGMGCTLNTLYELFCEHARVWFGKEIVEPVERFIPSIDFSRYDIGKVANLFQRSSWKQWHKRVLVSNGTPQSGQTRMPAGVFEKLIADLVEAHPSVLFLLSDKSDFAPPNVVYTRDMIGLPEGACDLPENGYVSTQCDVVVGRASGAYSFAYLADNFMNPAKTMVCFTDDERTARWVIPYDATRAKILWSADYALDSMRALVEEAIR